MRKIGFILVLVLLQGCTYTMSLNSDRQTVDPEIDKVKAEAAQSKAILDQTVKAFGGFAQGICNVQDMNQLDAFLRANKLKRIVKPKKVPKPPKENKTKDMTHHVEE